ncbi:MAG: secretion system protein [Chloroflexi bacterium HGW-Chloroflexi-10]|nr:MAG: secretion system protein [Chloroflexi bacterium HGW-Chloroflexi-10]
MDINQLLGQINPITILAIGGSVALIMLFIGIAISVSSDRNTMELERLGRYIEEDEILSEKERARPLTDWLNRRVAHSSMGEKISRNLSRADLKFKPGEYIALVVITSIFVAFLLWFIGGKSIIVGLIGLLVGSFLPGMYVKRQQSKRLVKFEQQLPDMLNLMVNGLRAGFSTMQAMEAVSKELPPPICDEFRRVVQEMQLGVTMEKALENLLGRIPSDDLDLTITAINVQREVGGNLAEIMDIISYTIRERIRIKGEIRVLTTQVMYSGKFLSMLPLFVMGILYLLNREYMMVFFKPESFPCGYIALAVSALLIFFGYIVMNKISDIEV